MLPSTLGTGLVLDFFSISPHAGFELRVTQPRRLRSAFDTGKPIAEREQEEHHADPDQVYDPEIVTTSFRPLLIGRHAIEPVSTAEASIGKADCQAFDEEPMEEIEKQRNPAKDYKELANGSIFTVKVRYADNRGTNCHQEEEKRRRIFLAIDERKNCETPILLHRPGAGLAGLIRNLVAVEVCVAQGDEKQYE